MVHQPDAVATEIRRRRGVAVVQVVEPRGQAGEIAHAVAVRVGEAADEHLVEHTPRAQSCCHAGESRAGRASRTVAQATAALSEATPAAHARSGTEGVSGTNGVADDCARSSGQEQLRHQYLHDHGRWIDGSVRNARHLRAGESVGIRQARRLRLHA
jgi:hypothetical protein